jgi:DNA mismatch endonuclease (patch repair protein)
VDTLSPEERSERMSRVRGKDTGPEWAVRQLVHSMGYRYRLHARDLPGRPDLVFRKRRKVIFIHGCFWHRHPAAGCALARLPKSRLDFWLPKLEGNRERDERNRRALVKAGWKVLTIWECELNNAKRLRAAIRRFLDA